jgi:hypothetical protein
MARLVNGLLALILLAAALLRVVGIDRDLRHGAPTPDESTNFVAPVMRMWDERSLNPRVHAGYPGLFNVMAFLPMGAGRALGGETGACLAARLLVAAAGTLNVLLLFLVVRPLWGAGAGLLGAALLAVSRSEISEGHFITPDVLVVSAFFALLLTLRARPGSAWAGAWAGLATAVKYSGVLLFPAVVADFFFQRRLRRLVPALAWGAAAFAAAAPFALLWRGDQQRGITEFVAYYFGGGGGGLLGRMAGRLGEVLAWISTNLAPPALGLAVLSVRAPGRRALAAPLAVLVASLAVLSLAGQVYPRHILLASGAVTVCAAAGFAFVRGRLPRWGAAALALAVLVVPAWRGLAVAAGYARPTELARAAGWIESQGRTLRIATPLERLRLEGPVEVRTSAPVWEWPPETLLHYDLVLAPRSVARRLAGLTERAVFEHRGDPEGAIVLLGADPPPDVAWPPPASAAGTAPGAEQAWDGRPETSWMAPEGSGWLEARWPAARRLHAIEVTAAEGEGYWPQRLRLFARRGEGEWGSLDVIALRPARARLQQPPHGQVFLLRVPVEADGLRIERRDGAAWGLREVRLYSLEAGAR